MAAPAPLCKTAFRTHTCNDLRLADVGKPITIAGWVQMCRNMGPFCFVDVRDRYGITQVMIPKEGLEDKPLPADAEKPQELFQRAVALGRETVVQISGVVTERSSKNPDRATGEVEVLASRLVVLNESALPPFLIEDETDAKEETRMLYRYLDIRRNPIKNALMLRNKVTRLVRDYLGDREFVEVETPILIKSTPEGARDFVVPSRMNPGGFYALPQSPQTFKQLIMVAGMDRYFQIAKCFRDEELRADRQPEFTQIDCEMSFVSQEDVLLLFEGLVKRIFNSCLPNADIPQIGTGTGAGAWAEKEAAGPVFPEDVPFERMEYSEAMDRFGIDKPDLRYGMELVEISDLVQQGKTGFKLFEENEYVGMIVLPGQAASYSTKKLKELEKRAVSEEVGAKNKLVWLSWKGEGQFDCGAKQFFGEEDYKAWVARYNEKNPLVGKDVPPHAPKRGCQVGDVVCLFAGPRNATQEGMGKFRHILGTELGFRDSKRFGFKALWVVNFPMFEWDEEDQRYFAKHHPFTSPWETDVEAMKSVADAKDPRLEKIRANAYDCVINGVEVGGGSIRIADRELQLAVFRTLGMSEDEAKEQFGFLMNAFSYGAPPHGGLAFGLDRLCTLLGNRGSIRDFIAFPKNNSGRDTMIESPSTISEKQLQELSIAVAKKPAKA